VSLEKFADPDPLIGTLASVKKRLADTDAIGQRSIRDSFDLWREALASIADKEACPQYGGRVKLEPQFGLVPVGRDRTTGLWEFGHLATGEIPRRDSNGELIVNESTGLVFVLLPAGTFRMGAIVPAKKGDRGPNLDPRAEKGERPVHDVALDAFFMSKYEMSQSQWKRFTGTSPSDFGPEASGGSTQHSLLHPVENVSYIECNKVLTRLGLDLPTGAQWEYAARAGTTTVWWTGDSVDTLKRSANLADQSLEERHPDAYPCDGSYRDDFVFHAPVHTFPPNPWGLYNVAGNVWEWVRDTGHYQTEVRPGDGLRTPINSRYAGYAGLRGGAWTNLPGGARSANRYLYAVTNKDNDTGVRPIFVQRPAKP
jgi:formylglycine-generating enzyme required for sulfatase activity